MKGIFTESTEKIKPVDNIIAKTIEYVNKTNKALYFE